MKRIRSTPFTVSVCIGLSLTFSPAAKIAAQTGTIVGKVSREKQSPQDPDRPLKGARIFVEIGLDDKGLAKLEEVKRSESNGVYRFDYVPGFRRLVIHKEPFWTPPKNREVEVRRGKKTPSVTTYLERHKERVTIALKARDTLIGGDEIESKRLLVSLVSFCNLIENEECDLVRWAEKALQLGDVAAANAMLFELGSILTSPIQHRAKQKKGKRL